MYVILVFTLFSIFFNCFKLTNLEIRGSQLFRKAELALVSLDP